MARRNNNSSHRLNRMAPPSQRHWAATHEAVAEHMGHDVAVDMGWGRLLFAHTFGDSDSLKAALCREARGQRDIALYVRDPHVVLSLAPQELFLDPSHTFRLWAHQYRPAPQPHGGVIIRRMRTLADAQAVNRIYASRSMVTFDPAWAVEPRDNPRMRLHLIAEDAGTGQIVGAVTGVDHVEAFNDPEKGASLWCLAVDPQAMAPGVGEALVRHMVEHYFARERVYVDLSVMHENDMAIRLYEKLGFVRVPAFCIKHKNPINEPLFTGPHAGAEEKLNVYGRIIVDEARRRGIAVEVYDAEEGYFALHLGGRTVNCRESLTSLTSAVAMSRCDDKRVTRRVLERAGLAVPAQRVAGDRGEDAAFLSRHGRIVVKPARGEQGAGVSVDIRSVQEMEAAIETARRHCERVVLEQFVEGDDLRIIVIDGAVVAAAVRRPPVVTGTGQHTVLQLIEKYNRRRGAATDGQSQVPLDEETARCVRAAGFAMDATPPAGEAFAVRKAANLHTGGTIHDVTDRLNLALAKAAVEGAEALNIPVVGFDFITPDVEREEYVIIEANERPGLANHEPQPTAERFIDFLFPNTSRSGPLAPRAHPLASEAQRLRPADADVR